MLVKNQLRHQGYSLGVLIHFGNCGQSLDLLENHSNISGVVTRTQEKFWQKILLRIS